MTRRSPSRGRGAGPLRLGCVGPRGAHVSGGRGCTHGRRVAGERARGDRASGSARLGLRCRRAPLASRRRSCRRPCRARSCQRRAAPGARSAGLGVRPESAPPTPRPMHLFGGSGVPRAGSAWWPKLGVREGAVGTGRLLPLGSQHEQPSRTHRIQGHDAAPGRVKWGTVTSIVSILQREKLRLPDVRHLRLEADLKDRETVIFHELVQSSNVPNNWNYTRQKPETWNSLGVSQAGGSDSNP